MKIIQPLIQVILAAAVISGTASAEIEAVKGKRYTLSKNHGPWMIMVTSIRDVKEEDRRIDGGMTAWEAADEIVYELRKKGIPAYTYTQDEESQLLQAPVAGKTRRYIAQQGYISILAANFKSNTEKDAKNVLAFVKNKFNPAFLNDEKNGGILPKTPGRPTPFSRAFFTINPLYEGEVVDHEKDNLLLGLNEGQKYSILGNRGKYTLVVASFHGSSVVQIGSNTNAEAMNFFEKRFGSSLDECAENAMKLTECMRNASKFGYDEDIEAYVFHDEHRSMVTVGAFDSKDDPRIRQLYTRYAGKPGRHAQTGADVVIGETFTVPRRRKFEDKADFEWVFDAEPKLMEVPQFAGSGPSSLRSKLLRR